MGQRHIGFGSETTWNTTVTPTRFFEALSENVAMTREYDRIETVRNWSYRDIVLLNEVVSGDVEILANYDGIGIFYEQLYGSVDTTTGSVNTHTFPANAGIPSTDRIGLSLTGEFRRETNMVWTYGGLKVTAFEHRFGTDQASRFTVSLLGASETTTTGTGTAASYSTLLPMHPAHVTTVSFDGGGNVRARNVTLRFENNVDSPIFLGSAAMAVEPDRDAPFIVTGSMEVLFEDFTEYNKYDGSTVADFQLISTNTTESVTYNMNKTRLIQATPAMQGRDRLSATYEFESYYDTDATENSQVVLVNNDATAS